MAARFTAAVNKFRQTSPEIYIVLDDSDEQDGSELATTSTCDSRKRRCEEDKKQPDEPKKPKETDDASSTCMQHFEQFFQTCRHYTKSEDDKLILTRTQDKFAPKCQQHLKPAELACLLATIEEKVIQNPDKVFVFVKEVITEIKAWKGKSKTRPNGQHFNPDLPGSSASTADAGATSAPKTPLPPSSKHVKKLEKLLKDLSRRIKEMEEEENTLEDLDDEDSLYIQLDRYKRRYMQVWKKLCDIAGRSHSTGRAIDRKFTFQASRYPEINRRVEHLVRRRKMSLPDYNDILNIVSSENLLSQLHLNSRHVSKIAEDIFLDVGNELKKRRQTDDYSVLGCHLTENLPEDPAVKDDNLRTVLDLNFEDGCKRIDKVLGEYTQKQLELGMQSEDVPDGLSDPLDRTADESVHIKSEDVLEDKNDIEETEVTNKDIADVPNEDVVSAAVSTTVSTTSVDQFSLTTRVMLGSLTSDYMIKREAINTTSPVRKILSLKRQKIDHPQHGTTDAKGGASSGVLRSTFKPFDSDDEDVVVLD